MTTLTAGEALRDRGCMLAASKRPATTLELQILILECASQNKPFTVDDILAPDSAGNRTNHTGAAFLAVSLQGLIRFTGQFQKSNRDKRHAGYNRVWEAVDASHCKAKAALLRQVLVALTSPPIQGELFTEQGGDA